MMAPRVPPEQLGAARALKNPLPAAPAVIQQGKALYEGKGGCANCHGSRGGGDGPLAAGLDPSPRDFRHHGFWRHRSDGELHWVIKNGIAGTAMIGFSTVLGDDEMWAIIHYERTFAERMGGHMGRGGTMGREGMGGASSEPCCDRTAPDRDRDVER
jgi:mono/diheme cytochrome c family protein